VTEPLTINVLGKYNYSEFLTEYWQKQPLLIKNAIPGFQCPITGDELAGLACEYDVESRLVLEHIIPNQASRWELRHGPFDESAFSQLPASHWTLLVQECNKHVPALAVLLERFRFIPDWRVDDVMVSYAAPNGSVGPHIDQYDVFLLQGAGQRQWQIDCRKQAETNWLPDSELRILQEFNSEQQWLLEPGDMLYLPPGVAHYGVAQGECMTLSIGFRAPSHYDLLSAFAEDQFADISDPFLIPRYQDPDLTLQQHSGEITSQAMQNIIEILQSYTREPRDIKSWFGRYITQSSQHTDQQPPDPPYDAMSLQSALQQHAAVTRSEFARYAFITHNAKRASLFIDGKEYLLTQQLQELAPLICDRRCFDSQLLMSYLSIENGRALLLEWFNLGYLYFNDSSE